MTLLSQEYYQGSCLLQNARGKTLGAITINLSQAFEQQKLRKIFTAVFLISGIAIGLTFIFLWGFSRRSLHSIAQLVNVMTAAAAGDLSKTSEVMTHDEIGMLSGKLNQMILKIP